MDLILVAKIIAGVAIVAIACLISWWIVIDTDGDGDPWD